MILSSSGTSASSYTIKVEHEHMRRHHVTVVCPADGSEDQMAVSKN